MVLSASFTARQASPTSLSPAGQRSRADGPLMRSVYPLEACDGVSTRRFWAWQGNLRVPNWCQIHRQHRRSAQPSQRLPQRHSGTAARVLWCSRPCPSPSWPSVGPRAAHTVIGHRRRQAAQRLDLGQKQMGLMRRTIHQVRELSSRRLCSRYESRSAGGVVFLFDECLVLCWRREESVQRGGTDVEVEAFRRECSFLLWPPAFLPACQLILADWVVPTY
jgi:hypothetical protein